MMVSKRAACSGALTISWSECLRQETTWDFRQNCSACLSWGLPRGCNYLVPCTVQLWRVPQQRGSSSLSPILSSRRERSVLCASELTRLLSLTFVEMQLEISTKEMSAPRSRELLLLLLLTVVSLESRRDLGTSF